MPASGDPHPRSLRPSSRLALAALVSTGLAIGGAPAGGAETDPLADPGAARALEEIRPEALRAHMRFLADDLLEGRATGSRGYEVAARYMAAGFEQLGLEPAGEGSTFFQWVPLRTSQVLPEHCSLVARGPQGRAVLQHGRDYLAADDPLQEESAARGGVVFAGYGVTAPEAGLDDYRGIDARGNLVALLRGAPASLPPDQRAYYASAAVKRENAVAHGAIGMLTVLTAEDEARRPWARRAADAARPGMAWLDAGGRPAGVRPELRAAAVLSRSGSEKLLAGSTVPLAEVLGTTPSQAPPASGALPVEASLRFASRHGHVRSPNVAALLRGRDPRLRDEVVVFTAHLDHLGVGLAEDGDAIYNGAYDNASGSAALLLLARAFASLPRPPRRSLLFLAVTGEEEGLLGSDYFVHHPTVALDAVVASVNLDMLLMLQPLRDVVAFGAEHSSLGPAVAAAAAHLGLAVRPDPVPDEVIFIRSDQYSFVRQGVPAVFLVAGPGDAPEGFFAWLRATYHRPGDDMNQSMDFAAGVQLARLNFLLGYLVAEGSEPPKWSPGDFFAERFAVRKGRRGPGVEDGPATLPGDRPR